ncbi:MAG: stage II sporulation protein R [bacterium]|nr:stage II sporulation protein R [bacterium]
MKKIILIIFFLIIFLIVVKNNTYEQIIIPNESIRIRVIANSDSIEDQNLKKRVKSSIEKGLSTLLKDSKNIEEVRSILKENLTNIEYTVEEELNKNAEKKIEYEVNYGYNYFPQKVYKGINYEEGYYESIVIKLGKAQGENWWCVLFPPLCLIEDNEKIEDVEYKSYIKEIIDKYF